ncbi:hypothetical protein GGS23DRAFT_554491 [Durotheca rogersii]|uniref:uncharacterized protein n=1 Tax=Durotheca rogersii TaxID=419775 RepID=UPI0022208338|nr:uncharacterized protein GGS23DRAFT_554491 [Durotheca rogersii]KAI5865892.1 hypothetical protein GGS23DRAFT_554491 [Durotheca rogersii]
MRARLSLLCCLGTLPDRLAPPQLVDVWIYTYRVPPPPGIACLRYVVRLLISCLGCWRGLSGRVLYRLGTSLVLDLCNARCTPE